MNNENKIEISCNHINEYFLREKNKELGHCDSCHEDDNYGYADLMQEEFKFDINGNKIKLTVNYCCSFCSVIEKDLMRKITKTLLKNKKS